MRIPQSLQSLVDDGIIEEVLRPLMSGKEAQIYLIVANGGLCAAKVYKDAQKRSFKNRADYTEGRKVRNSRDQRALNKGSRYGKAKDEEAWKSTEVDTIFKLHNAGVRVPVPYTFMDGVLVMELVSDYEGQPAPRLGDLHFSPDEAREVYDYLISQTMRMLCAGIVHGDLSDFNVLLSADGPVIIDFPQSVSAAGNLNARRLLVRDVENLHRFLRRWVPGARRKPYAEEMWDLYEKNKLTVDTQLTGTFRQSSSPVDTTAVMELIGDANRDQARTRRTQGKHGPPQRSEEEPREATPSSASPLRRREVVVVQPARTNHRTRRPSGAASTTGPARDRHQRGASESRNRRNQPEPRRGGRPKQGDHKTPKRGASAQASTYVSPEARKTKVKALTPRSPEKPSRTQRQEDNNGENRRSRRRRTPQGEGAPSAAQGKSGRSQRRDLSPTGERNARLNERRRNRRAQGDGRSNPANSSPNTRRTASEMDEEHQAQERRRNRRRQRD